MRFVLSIFNYTGHRVAAPTPDTMHPEQGSAAIFVQGRGSVTVEYSLSAQRFFDVVVNSGNEKYSLRSGSGEATLTLTNNQTWILQIDNQSLEKKIEGFGGRFFTVPSDTRIYLTGLCNAANLQRLTLTINGERSAVWTGRGDYNTHICDETIRTPYGSGLIDVAVNIESSGDNGANWKPSNMPAVGQYQIMGFNQRVILSEDSTDDDYNDCALLVQWWTNP